MRDTSRLQRALDDFVSVRDVPGATAAVIDGHGKTWVKAGGVADPDASRPMTPDEGVPTAGATRDRYELKSCDALIRPVT